jgi:CheY-like chemotaxis protein
MVILQVMSQQLRKLGCVVHTADNGQDCLDFLQKTVFTSNSENVPLSIILMDLEVSLLLSFSIRGYTDYSTDASNGRLNLRTKNQRI